MVDLKAGLLQTHAVSRRIPADSKQHAVESADGLTILMAYCQMTVIFAFDAFYLKVGQNVDTSRAHLLHDGFPECFIKPTQQNVFAQPHSDL